MTALVDLAARLATLTLAELVALERDVALEERARVAAPLAYRTLWHREAPRTSQRDAVAAFLAPGVRSGIILGGNRSGKSEAGAQIVQAYALGGDHPAVVAWGRRNGIDIGCIPHGPDLVWDVALTHQDSRRYVRSKHRRLAPPGSRWRNEQADNEAELVLPNGGKVVFKAVTQKREGFQGDAIRLARFDEEPNDDAVISETLMRLVDKDGRMLSTMSPLSGWTAFLRQNVREAGPNHMVRWLHGEDNPHVSAKVLRELLSRFGAHEQAARARGMISALEGRIYDRFDERIHVAAFAPLPSDRERYQAADWGTSVPTCILHATYDHVRDVVYVEDEWYEVGTTIGERAAAIRAQRRARGEVALFWADPEDASTNTTLVLEHDIAVAPATKAVKHGINVVSARLTPDLNGDVHLIIHPRCRRTLDEISAYVWEGPDKPRKRDDHAMDTLRYLCVGIGRTHGVGLAAGGG